MSTLDHKQKNLKPREKRQRTALFALVPRDFLLQPPICSADKPLKGSLSPFECALNFGLVTVARWQIFQDRKQRAREAGARNIEREKDFAKRHRDEWRQVKAARRRDNEELIRSKRPEEVKRLLGAPKRKHAFPEERPESDEYSLKEWSFDITKRGADEYHPAPLDAALKEAGRHGYKMALRELKHSPPPQVVTVTLTRSAWLRMAGLSRNESNRRALDASLPIFTKSILLVDGQTKVPLLRDWKELPDGRLQLQVDGEWLESSFGLVPMPLPMRSAPALALYLFLRGINTRHRKASRVAWLCKLIGIDPDQRHWRRDLTRAFDVINDHLGLLDVTEAMQRRLRKHKVPPVARSYQADMIEDGQIRVTAIAWHYRGDFGEETSPDDAEPARIVKRVRPHRKPSIKRVLPTRRSPEPVQQQQDDNEEAEHRAIYKAAMQGDREARVKLDKLVQDKIKQDREIAERESLEYE
jgi:hypothetical protein